MTEPEVMPAQPEDVLEVQDSDGDTLHRIPGDPAAPEASGYLWTYEPESGTGWTWAAAWRRYGPLTW